jgi:hypothetical protein
MSFAGKWMEQELIILCDKSGSERLLSHVFCHIWNLGLKYKKNRDMNVKGDYLGED